MKYILLLAVLFSTYSQDVLESIKGKTLRYEFKGKESRGAFLALPNASIRLTKTEGIRLEYAFTRKGNKFYEILNLSDNAIVEIETDADLKRFSRKKDVMSVNQLFLAKSIRKKKTKQVASYLTNPNSVVIKTDKRAVYKLTYSYLLSQGIDIFSIDVSRLKLFNKGNEIPIFVESGADQFINRAGDFVLFIAELSRNTNYTESDDLYYDPYDFENTYWLVEKESSDTSPGKRMFLKSGINLEQDDNLLFKPEYFERSVHLEENTKLAVKNIPNLEAEYANHGFFHNRDYNFWGNTITDDVYQSYKIDVLNDYFDTSSGEDAVSFSVMMSGSASKYTGLHKAEFKVSSSSFLYEDTTNWRYSYKKKVDFQIPYSSLKNENSFEVRAGVTDDQLLLNWIDLSFKSKFKAKSNYLEFNSIKPTPHPDVSKKYTHFEYTISGFSSTASVNIIKLNEAIIKNHEEKFTSQGKDIVFQDEIENENAKFIIFSDDYYAEPTSIEKNSVYADRETLVNHKSDAQMLIITTKLFLNKAQEYADYKTSQSIKTEVVSSEKIFKEFNYGHKSPMHVKEFLKYAYENWSDENQLKYVLFVGDAKRNYKDGNKLNYIVPTFQFISQKFGFVNSDAFYGYLYHSKDDFVDFNGNPIMDVYIGRIPAESVDEFDAYFDKLREYDSASPQENNLFLTGNDYNQEGINSEFYTGERVFVRQASKLNNNPNNIQNATILKRAADDPFGSTSTLLQESSQLQSLFNKGLNYVAFIGHGAGAVWGDRNIMLQEDASRLQNTGKYPLVSSFTCFIGAFDGGRTLGEELILLRNKGAIGILGASGVSLIYNQYMFGYYVNDYVLQNRYSYGEALSLGKFKFYQRGGNYITDTSIEATPEHYIHKNFLLMEFNYLGDPSVQIKFPEKKQLSTSTDEISEGSNLAFTVSDIPNDTYSVKAFVMDYIGEVISDTSFVLNISSGKLVDSIPIPMLTSKNRYYLKGSLKSNTNTYNFGRQLEKQASLYAKSIRVVDPSTLAERKLLAGGDYKLSITLSDTITSLSSSITITKFDQSTPSRYDLSFIDNGNNEFVSAEVFRVAKDAVDLEIAKINVNTGSETHTLSSEILDVKPTKYLLNPLANSLLVSYDTKTNLQVTVAYPISYKKELRAFTDFYRMNGADRKFLGRDTIYFTEINQNLLSRLSVLEDYTGSKDSYYIHVYSDSLNLELDTVNQSLTSVAYKLPNAHIAYSNSYIDTIDINTLTQVRLSFEANNFSSDSASSLLDMSLSQSYEAFQFDNPRNLLASSVLNVNYYNGETIFQNIDASNFTLLFQKDAWKTFDRNKVKLLHYDASIKKWLEEVVESSVDADSTLHLNIQNGLTKSGQYAIIELDETNPYSVVANVEVNGLASDSIQYTSLNPQIKFNLNSQSDDYIVNPANVSLFVLSQSGFEETVPFSYSYSGVKQRNLNIIVENDQSLSQDGSFELRLQVKGFVTLKKQGENGLQNLKNNEFRQQLRVSGNDAMTVYGNYPNPFGAQTIFGVQLSSSNSDLEISLTIKIYSMSGRLVKTLNEGEMLFVTDKDNPYSDPLPDPNGVRVGQNYIVWDGKDSNGSNLANGVYFAKIIFDSSAKTIEKVIKVAKLNGYSR